MKTIAIILFVLQVISIFGGIIDGTLFDILIISNASDISELIGYFLPSIIGVILFVKSKKKDEGNEE